MKTIVQAAVVAAMLTTGAAQAADQYVTRYTLDGDGDLVAQQYLVEDNSDKVWKTVLIVIGGVAGIYLLGEAFDVWDDDDPAPVQQPSNGLVPISGTQQSSFDTQFIYPSYAPVQ